MEHLDVRMLGRFEVSVDDRVLPDGAFGHRRAADLVKVLALARGHRMARDRVVELLWPQLGAEAGIANLHKAAHYARRALGAQDGVVLRQGLVELVPGAAVTTDVERFEAGDDDAYAGELLPDDRYEEWAVGTRERLRERRLGTLRREGRWADVLVEEPADEQAHRALMAAHLESGDRLGAARQYRLLGDELARLGLHPSAETVELGRRLVEGPAVQARRVLDGQVIGREPELSRAVAALRGAAEGRGAALLVIGGAGMGKSRYVEAVLTGAERRGWHTLRGRARAGGAGVPYLPAVEALDPLLVERPDLAARLSPGSRAALAALTPTIAEEPPDGPVGRHRVLTAVHHLLREAALDRGVVLVLEDLHAADEATLELADFLAAGARSEPMLVVLSARPVAPGEPSARLRDELRQGRLATEVLLGPLTDEAVVEIAGRAAGRPLPPETATAIATAAAGNPFYARELAEAVDGSGRVHVPRRLQDLLDARLARLPAPLLQVLPALAVLEDGFSADELAAVAGLPVAQARARLATGAREDLLEEDARGWRVRHPLLREAARGRTTGDELVRAHDAAATALARRDAAPERIAYHLLRAGRGRDATPHLIAAARHAGAVGAYADGRRWVDTALRQADDAQKGVLFALLGDLRFATGDRTALSAYASALRHAPDEVQPDLKSKQGLAAIALGDLDGAEQALAGLPAGTVAQRARASVVMAILAWYRGDIDRSAGLVEQADALAAAAGEEVAMLADVRAMVAHAQGRWDAHANWELSEVWHLPQLAGRVFDAYLCVTEYVLHSGDPYERLIGFASDLRGQAVQAGARRGEAFSATVLGEAQLLRGDAEAARAALGDAVRISREVGAVAGEALARARLGEALFALGDPAGARAHLEEALELSHASSLASHLLFLVHAPLLRVQDDLDAALALVASSSVLLEDLAACNFCPVTYALAAGSVCARAGEPDRAEAFLERAERSAGLWPPGVWSPAVCEVRGEILVARGAPDAGITLRRALEGYAASGQGLNERRVRETIAGMAG